MTSPSITKSPKPTEKKSPVHSANGTDTHAPVATGATASPPQQPETFSWLRIFKLADLMMKQGC